MKSKLSSIVAILFIAFTLITGGTGVVKANDAIRPDISGTGTLTIHKHWAIDNSNIGVEGNGQEQTVTNPAVSGVKFNIYQLTPADANSPVTPPSEKDGAVYAVNEDKDELTVTFKGNTYKYTMAAPLSGTTIGSGVYEFTGLEGFYYVEEDLKNSDPKVDDKAVKITTPAKPFIVSVPMTKPDGSGWFKDVHVYPKNQGMAPEKTVNNGGSNSVNIGDELEFGIKVAIPIDIGDPEYSVFNINDELDPALTYMEDSVKVYVYKDNGSGWDKVEIPNVGNANYTIQPADPTAGTGNENTLSVKFTATGRTELANYLTSTGGSYTHVGIEFVTTVNENVVSKPNYSIKNKGEIEWTNTPGEETIKTPDTETNTGDIDIDKKDQAGKKLPGAEFQIAQTKADAEDGSKYIKVKVKEKENDPSSWEITDLVYPGETGYDTALNWVVRPHADPAADPRELGLSEDGKTFYALKFQGLQTHTGLDDKKVALKYYVVETKAPEGFNLLDEPTEVDFANEAKTHIVSKEIVNSKGFKLPKTGSLGMIVLTIVGIVLIGLAILMFLPKKRRS